MQNAINKINTMLDLLEKNPIKTKEDFDKIKKYYEQIVQVFKINSKDSKVIVKKYNDLVLENQSNITGITPIENIAKLSEISPKSVTTNYKGLRIAMAALAASSVIGLAGCSLTSCNGKQPEIIEETTTIEEPTVEVEEIKEKILPEDWTFDPNDNIELVNRMSDFIYNAVVKGIPVKDVMTEEEIALANEKEENLVTIEQLMDFYIVMNIEDIDPADFARLQYFTKTKETITDNYSYCARVFATDSLTATKDTEINYAGIINDKESGKAIQQFVDYLAEYNSTNDRKTKADEIFEYINTNYINKDANVYSISSNEFTYRLMFDADLISNNSIIPKDINIILNEDGKLTCASSDKTDDGIKDKTERAEEYTSLSNAVGQKLEISREFYNQDLTNISIEEQKTGLELEKEIKEKVLSMNVEYHANEKFTMSEDSKNIAAKKDNSTSYTKLDNGKNVSNEELAKYGAKNQAEYEAAKKAEFERNAQQDPNHTIKDPNGDVVVSGPEVDTVQYNSGYAAGYYDGNNKLAKNPTVSNESYKAGYKVGYEKGLADRNELDAKLQQPAPIYEPIENGPVTPVDEVIIEQPYVPTEPEVTPEPTPIDDGTWEEFEPVNESSISESTTTIDYTSSIDRLEQMKKELMDLANIYAEETTNIKC